MKLFAQSEFESTKRDAFSSQGKTPEERTAMFIDLMATIEAIQSHLTHEERERRQRIADQIDPRPDPWWRNCRKEALAEYARTHEADQKELERLIEEYSRDTADDS
jgi:hypothetical protein